MERFRKDRMGVRDCYDSVLCENFHVFFEFLEVRGCAAQCTAATSLGHPQQVVLGTVVRFLSPLSLSSFKDLFAGNATA